MRRAVALAIMAKAANGDINKSTIQLVGQFDGSNAEALLAAIKKLKKNESQLVKSAVPKSEVSNYRSPVFRDDKEYNKGEELRRDYQEQIDHFDPKKMVDKPDPKTGKNKKVSEDNEHYYFYKKPILDESNKPTGEWDDESNNAFRTARETILTLSSGPDCQDKRSKLKQLEYDQKILLKSANTEDALDSACVNFINHLLKKDPKNGDRTVNDFVFNNRFNDNITESEVEMFENRVPLKFCQENRSNFLRAFGVEKKTVMNGENAKLDDWDREVKEIVHNEDLTKNVNDKQDEKAVAYVKQLKTWYKGSTIGDGEKYAGLGGSENPSAWNSLQVLNNEIRSAKKEENDACESGIELSLMDHFKIIGRNEADDDDTTFTILKTALSTDNTKVKMSKYGHSSSTEEDFAEVTDYHKYNEYIKKLVGEILKEQNQNKKVIVDIEKEERKDSPNTDKIEKLKQENNARRNSWVNGHMKTIEGLWTKARVAIKARIDKYRSAKDDGVIAKYFTGPTHTITADDIKALKEEHTEVSLVYLQSKLKALTTKMTRIFSKSQLMTLPYYQRIIRARNAYRAYQLTKEKIENVRQHYAEKAQAAEDEEDEEKKKKAEKVMKSFDAQAAKFQSEEAAMRLALEKEVYAVIELIRQQGTDEELQGSKSYVQRDVSADNDEDVVAFATGTEYDGQKFWGPSSTEKKDALIDMNFYSAIRESLLAEGIMTRTDNSAGIFKVYFDKVKELKDARVQYELIKEKADKLSKLVKQPVTNLAEEVTELKNQIGDTNNKLKDNDGNTITFKEKFGEIDSNIASNKKLGSWCLALLITTMFLNLLGFAIVAVQMKKMNEAKAVEEDDDEALLAGEESQEEEP